MEKVLITSALLYANGSIHFGHIAGAYLPADCYARYARMEGKDVLYLSGSDEYGVAITLSAELAQRTPQEQVDHFHAINQGLFKKLNFSFDYFARTTWEGHVQTTQEYFLDLLEKGYVDERETEQLYSPQEERFLADRYVIGGCPRCHYEKARGDECPSCGASFEATDLKNPVSKMTGGPLVLRKTKNWFLKLDTMKADVEKWLEGKNWKPNVLNFSKSFLKEIKPRAITRDSSWGVPIPLEGYEDKVFYVWFDAPIGYISAAKQWAKEQGDKDLWKKYWCDQTTRLVQFIGKDNIFYHAVMFPAMTLGQNRPYKLVDDLCANEFYNLEGKQFSKSDGWYIDLADFLTRYSSDQVRYALAATSPENSDSEFRLKDFQSLCNGDLVGKYGNFAHRVLTFLQKSCGGKIPQNPALDKEDRDFIQQVHHQMEEVSKSYSQYRLRQACQHLMGLAQLGNIYFDRKAPWKLAKEPEIKEALEGCLFACLVCLKALALISFPIIPEAASQLFKMLGEAKKMEKILWREEMTQLNEGMQLPNPHVLFQKIEDEAIEKEEILLKSSSKAYEPLKEEIGYEDFSKLDLRVGKILEVVEVKKSKKLLQLTVDLGFERRTILSGIKEHCSPESLLGKKVIVVANLKPAKLMGIESQGMILAASDEIGLEVVSIQEMEEGSVVS